MRTQAAPDAGTTQAAPGAGTGTASDEAGFTLLEIVVALVVLGILLVTLSRGMQFGIAAFDRQDRMVVTGGRLEAVDRTLRRLITEADPGTSNDGRTLVGAAHALAMRAPLPTAATVDPGQEGEDLANLRLSVENGALVLTTVPYRHVIPTGPQPEPHRTVLLDGIETIDLSYWSEGAWHTQWQDDGLPGLVRIRLVFPEGDSRRWPDIVVAPAREQSSD